MKKFAIIMVTVALCAFTACGLMGCGSSSTQDQNASSTTTTSTVTEEPGTGPLDIAPQFATDEGVTGLDYESFQQAASKVNYGMTLAQIREIMGANGTVLTDSVYEANTIAFYTADKNDTLLVVLDGLDNTSILVSCKTSVE